MKHINTFKQTILYISVILFLLIPTLASASATLKIHDNKTSYTDFNVDYMEEPSGSYLDIEDIKKTTFQKQTSNRISLGYQKNEFWFHTKLINTSGQDKTMVLEFTEVFHKNVDLYIVSDTETIEKKNGFSVPIKKREIQESNPSFMLTINAGKSKDIYLKIATDSTLFGAIIIKTTEAFYADTQMDKYIYIAFFSAIIILILYNLVLFLYVRDKIYFYYISYVIVFITWVAHYKGFLLYLLDMKNIYFVFMVHALIPMFFILLIIFSQSILETKKYFINAHRILIGFIIASIIVLIIMTISVQYGLMLMNTLALIILPTLIYIAIWAIYKNHSIAKIFLPALSIYMIGLGITGALGISFLPYNLFTSNAAIIAAIFEIILFSLLLAYRINVERNEALESKEQLFEQQKSESTRLFHTVSEKTKELNRAKKELEDELRKKIELEKHLQHLASTDPMTELFNRRAFFDIADIQIESIRREKKELTCMIIDIDHFKNINDTYGHDVGDKVIKAVAKLMLVNTRTVDHVGRIGGEEFAVLMPKTSLDAAYQIADRLRENISKHTISLDDKSIKITISIGLSILTDEDKKIHSLLKRADTALYKAKNNGRNQVCCL